MKNRRLFCLGRFLAGKFLAGKMIFFLSLMIGGQCVAGIKNSFDLSDSLLPEEEIHLSGSPKDGTPALDHPIFVFAKHSSLNDVARVLALELNGVAKAYPLDILEHHEVVNDHFGDLAVAVTFYPLCGTGMIFEGNAVVAKPGKSGEGLSDFGVSGLLYNSDVLLYDRATESLWSQLKMQAITGPRKGEKLVLLPAVHTTWREWRAEHPDTMVLSEHTGFPINYQRDPYAGYRQLPGLWFPVNQSDERYPAKSWVAGVIIDGKTKVYPLVELEDAPPEFDDEFSGQILRVKWSEENHSVKVMDQEGGEVPVVMAYWFAWYSFHPNADIYSFTN